MGLSKNKWNSKKSFLTAYFKAINFLRPLLSFAVRFNNLLIWLHIIVLGKMLFVLSRTELRLASNLSLVVEWEVLDVILTQVCFHSIHVGVVSLARDRIRASVAICEQQGGVVCDQGKEEQHNGTHYPAHLCHTPGQRQHSWSYHCCYHMCWCCPDGPCTAASHQDIRRLSSFETRLQLQLRSQIIFIKFWSKLSAAVVLLH